MKYTLLLPILLLTYSTLAQDIFEPPIDKLSVSAVYTESVINIDGKLSEANWNKAVALTDFVQVEPNQGESSAFRTVVKILYNEKNLYIGAYCEDLEGTKAIRVPDLTRDFPFRSSDTFAIGIDGFLDERNSITIATNPYGTQKDYLSFDDTYFDAEWNGLWKVRTTRTDKGWYAEFQIPWKSIRYGNTAESDSKWGINFVRLRRKSNEISTWSSYPRAFGFNRSEYFGLLTEVRPPEPSTNIQVNPYVLSDFRETKSNGELTTSNTDYTLGGELKWALNSNTLLDLTINTDFAQAEADRQVNNISRFSVFFPERRQFFLENASLFGTGLYSSNGVSGNLSIIPFFSRRIGLDTSGKPVNIDGGLRLVHRSAKSNFGVLGIREGSSEDIDGSYNFVGRYVHNFGKQNRLGVIATTKIEDEKSNVVGGIDGFFRLDKSNSIGVMGLASTDSDTDNFGLGGYVQYRYDTNGVNAWWTESYLGERFNPELGFISRTNVIATSPGITANYRGKRLPFKNVIRAFRPQLAANWFHEASTSDLSEREIAVSPLSIEAQNGAVISFTSLFIRQNISNSFSLLNEEIGIGVYDYTRYNLGLSTDPSSKVSTILNYEFGDFYNGKLNSINASLTLIPIPHFFLKGSFNRNEFKTLGTVNSSGIVNLYTLEGRIFLNPRFSLNGLYQRNDQNNSDFYNLRLSWEYSPLSYLYLVFNSNQNTTQMDTFLERQAIVKVSFLKQF
ncbi:DUF5916 domain-containing protein [Maribacter sp. IgM3_T14_3]|uniref:carbohydrate binding family 9 domain-containing protein n=1 Tax=Maribacter sp. IgM3_T14_3 TaxID=3415140 RepID=UPI003C6F119E